LGKKEKKGRAEMINPVHVEYKKSRYPTRNCHDGQEKEEETGENRRESI
jgi:hypothetical protein